jgi:hypothetical protein
VILRTRRWPLSTWKMYVSRTPARAAMRRGEDEETALRALIEVLI